MPIAVRDRRSLVATWETSIQSQNLPSLHLAAKYLGSAKDSPWQSAIRRQILQMYFTILLEYQNQIGVDFWQSALRELDLIFWRESCGW